MFSLAVLLSLSASVHPLPSPLDAVPCQLLFRPKDPQDAAAIVADHHLTLVRTLPHIHWSVVKTPCSENEPSVDKDTRVAALLARARKLASDPRVLHAEPDWIPVSTATNDTIWPLQWAFENVGQGNWPADNDINGPEAWTTSTGAGVVVAVIDSGVRWSHEDLVDQIFVNPADPQDGIDNDDNGYVDDVIGWDFVDDDNDPDDPVPDFPRGPASSPLAHGTFVAGLIAASTNNDLGVAGTAPDARLLPLRALGEGAGVSSIADAILYAVDLGVRVQNHSWGTRQQYVAIDDDAFAWARDHGAILVLAAGNDNRNLDAPGPDDYPGELDNDAIITVGAMTRGDFLHSFSNHGPFAVDVAAPGGTALWSTSNIFSGGVWSTGNYSHAQGTSFAAPIVAGIVALLLEVDPGLDARRAKEILIAASDASRVDVGGTFGGSYVRADRALAILQGAPAPPRARIHAPHLEERSWLVNVGATVQLDARVVDVDTPGSGLHHHWQLTPPRGSRAVLDNDAAAPRFVADLCGGYFLQHFVDDGTHETTIEERWLYAGFAIGADGATQATCAARPCSGDTNDELSFDVADGDVMAVHLASTNVDGIGGTLTVFADNALVHSSAGKGGAQWTAPFLAPAEVNVAAYSSFEPRVGAVVDALFFCDDRCPAGRFDCDDDASNFCESDTLCAPAPEPTEGEGEGEAGPGEGVGEGEGEGIIDVAEGEGEGDIDVAEGEGEGGVDVSEGEGEAVGGDDHDHNNDEDDDDDDDDDDDRARGRRELVEVRRGCSSAGAFPLGLVMVTLLVRRRSRLR